MAQPSQQPLYLRVQFFVLRLPERYPGATVQRHYSAPLAGISEVSGSARGLASGFSSHHFNYEDLAFPAMPYEGGGLWADVPGTAILVWPHCLAGSNG